MSSLLRNTFIAFPVQIGSGVAFTQISKETLGVAAGNFTQVAIPAGFTQIRVTILGKATAGTGIIKLVFNGDTGNNYFQQYLKATGATVTAVNPAATGAWTLADNYGAADLFQTVAFISNPTATIYRTGQAISGSGSTPLNFSSNISWANTGLITTIDISTTTSTFTIGSQLIVEGLK